MKGRPFSPRSSSLFPEVTLDVALYVKLDFTLDVTLDVTLDHLKSVSSFRPAPGSPSSLRPFFFFSSSMGQRKFARWCHNAMWTSLIM